jgi:RimJ/RimL family protein N-acetyltransferase
MVERCDRIREVCTARGAARAWDAIAHLPGLGHRGLKRTKQIRPPGEIALPPSFDKVLGRSVREAADMASTEEIMRAGGGNVVRLADGSEVVVRPIARDDASLLQAFVRRLSARSRRFRFFVALAELSAAQLERFVDVDPDRGVALVAIHRRREDIAIVAEARYALTQQDDTAEFAVAVADDFQERGLGRHLVERLVTTAWRRGVRRLFGEIKSDNRAMIALARRLGFRLRGSLEDESVVVAVMASSTGPLATMQTC